ncbi:MAG: site-specific integrase [Bellilinea sp.]
MAKRGHGEGSLYKRSNGTYRAQVTIEGNRVGKTFKLRKDAQDWIATINGQVKQGLTYNSAKTTVDELLTEWLKLKATMSRPATQESYQRMARLYISPAMGRLKLQEVSAARIQKFYSDLEKRGIGKRTIENTHTVLYGFLKFANGLSLTAQNWAGFVVVPRPEKREMKVWDESQVSLFLQFVNSDPFYRLAFSTGMRRGELLGLQWKDLDWNTGQLHVRRQVYRPEGGGFIFQTPKTDKGTRGIRLGKGMLEALRIQYNNTIPLMQAIAGNDWQEYDLMFPSTRGTPRDGYTVSKEFHHLVEKAGLPIIRFHDIRHTVASIMLLHGEPSVRVAGILGQTVQVLLSTYSHWIPDNQETAAILMDEITTPASFQITEKSTLHPIAPENQ